MNDAIVCQGLQKHYGPVTALAGLDLQVPAGTIFGFLGPNGAGKTTTVRLLTGLARPAAGQAVVAGINLASGGTALRERIGYLDQQPQFYGWMRGRELLYFLGQLSGLHGITLRNRVEEVLAQTGLTEAAGRKIGGYSGGMRQRLGLAQALLSRPQVLFLDEPASSLDPAGRRDVLDLIGGLRGQTTVFMSTHILSDVERICERVAIIDRGRLLVEAPVAELQARYAQPVYVLEAEADQQPELARLCELLGAEAWVNSISREPGSLRVVVHDLAAAQAALLPLVVSSKLVLARLERVRPSLEEIFLQLTGAVEALLEQKEPV